MYKVEHEQHFSEICRLSCSIIKYSIDIGYVKASVDDFKINPKISVRTAIYAMPNIVIITTIFRTFVWLSNCGPE